MGLEASPVDSATKRRSIAAFHTLLYIYSAQ